MNGIKPLTKKEITALYGVSYKTFSAWIAPFKKEIGKYNGRRFTIKQVEIIYQKIGHP